MISLKQQLVKLVNQQIRGPELKKPVSKDSQVQKDLNDLKVQISSVAKSIYAKMEQQEAITAKISTIATSSTPSEMSGYHELSVADKVRICRIADRIKPIIEESSRQALKDKKIQMFENKTMFEEDWDVGTGDTQGPDRRMKPKIVFDSQYSTSELRIRWNDLAQLYKSHNIIDFAIKTRMRPTFDVHEELLIQSSVLLFGCRFYDFVAGDKFKRFLSLTGLDKEFTHLSS
jgi:hypothetical protein